MAKKVEVLGPGCAKCRQLYEETERAVADLGIECELTKVTDIMKITEYGVMMTPALVVDGQVKAYGKVPSQEELKGMLS